MRINSGVIEASNGDVVVRVYYDNTVPVDQPQPLINGPRGWCLDLTNLTGTNRTVTMTLPNGTERQVTVGQGDPVTGGPVTGRSRTAAQMNALGFVNRSDVAGFTGPV